MLGTTRRRRDVNEIDLMASYFASFGMNDQELRQVARDGTKSLPQSREIRTRGAFGQHETIANTYRAEIFDAAPPVFTICCGTPDYAGLRQSHRTAAKHRRSYTPESLCISGSPP